MMSQTEAILAFPISLFVILRSLWIIGTNGLAAIVETKQGEIILIWGLTKEKLLKTLTLYF